MKVCMQIKDRNNNMSFGNQQVNKIQLFTEDWIQNNKKKRGDKMSKKYKENKEKEGEFLKRLKTLSVIHISDRLKLSRFSDAKINKVLKMYRYFQIFNVKKYKMH
jgi:hypothetical protein